MRQDDLRESSDIEDRRGTGGDRISQAAGRAAVRDGLTHGSSAQRVR